MSTYRITGDLEYYVDKLERVVLLSLAEVLFLVVRTRAIFQRDVPMCV